MDWLPLPSDFRASLQEASGIVSPDERVERFARIAQFQLSYLETIQLDNALQKAITEGKLPGDRVRLAILASSTFDHLLPAIRVAGLRRGLLVHTYSAGYGQYRQELFETDSALAEFRPDTVLFSITSREFLSPIPLGSTADEVERRVRKAVADLVQLWRVARERLDVSIIQQSILNNTEPLFGSHDRLVPASPYQSIIRANDLLVAAISTEAVQLLDVERVSALEGVHDWFDVGRWLHGKIEISPKAAQSYGELVARLIGAQRGKSRKCLVLDLDNTLWGGVIGDDGLNGIRLGEGTAAGEAHLALQKYAKSLLERGIVLAVCSKNEPDIAEQPFLEHPEMALNRSDISAFVANFKDKAENLLAIANQLNIGLDSLVFIDDDPVERARVRQSLPEVAVPELPADPAHYVRCIANAGYFEAISFTEEDQNRNLQYSENMRRDALRGVAQSLDDFLMNLEMEVEYGPIRQVDLTRVTQLINKTNQFNINKRRYTAEEINRLAFQSDTITIRFRLRDRFGDNGLVCVMILQPDGADPSTMTIDTWVMSCRVFGRQFELETMNIAAETAQAVGARKLQASFVPLAQDKKFEEIFKSLGFHLQPKDNDEGETTRWLTDLTRYEPRPTFITRNAS